MGHVTPEAQVGGPIALVQNGDRITIDAEANTINVPVSPDDFARRRKAWIAPPYKATRGTLYKYIKSVKTFERPRSLEACCGASADSIRTCRSLWATTALDRSRATM